MPSIINEAQKNSNVDYPEELLVMSGYMSLGHAAVK
jgi:hypothetical protein